MNKVYKFSVCIVLCLIQLNANAQSWTKQIKKKNPSFYEIRQAFYAYYKNHPATADKEAGREKENEYTQFKRWEWYWEQRVDKDGRFPSPSIVFDEWKKYVNSHSTEMARTSSVSGNWVSLGPTTSPGGYEGLGRVNCVAVDPTNGNNIWIGTPAGGLWKSVNGGTTWTTNTDNLPVMGVSDIVIDPTNVNNMYIATGDGDRAYAIESIGATYPGDTKSVGILKSTNGGVTWTTTGMNWSVTSAKLIRKLIINPSNPQMLIAATSDGIYRTGDRGVNWTQMAPGYFMDVVFKPGSPKTVYAASFPDTAQIYISQDTGSTWTKITNFGNSGRVALAVTPAAPNVVMAFVSRSQENLEGIYKSSNSGTTFTCLYDSSMANIMGYNYDGSDMNKGQGSYDLCLAISPTDSNLVYAGSINLWRSSNGGSIWKCVNMWNTDPQATADTVSAIHADKHWLSFSPVNTNILYQGCDGGVYKSDVTVTSGKIFTDLTNGLVISEVYRIATSESSPKIVLAGLQDNGTKKFNGSTWSYATGGDGMECLIDWADTTYMYATYTNGQLYANNDGFTTANYTTISTNIPGTPQGAWVTPYVSNPQNSNGIFAGYDDVYRSANKGVSWTKISNTLPGSGNTLNSLAVAPSDSNTIYTATWAKLWVTTNGGAAWTDITANLSGIITGFYKISYLSVHPTNPQIIYVSIGGYNATCKAMMSKDGGATFTNITGTLPNVSASCIIPQKSSPNGLYIGTENGVFYRDTTLTDWIPFNTGLPNVGIGELEIQYSANRIVAGTFGRGVWASDLYSNTVAVNSVKSKNDRFSVVPNPSNGLFTLYVSEFNSSDRAYLYNYLGETVKEIPVRSASQSIDIGDLSPGIYYLALKSDNFRNLLKLVKVN